MTKYGVSSTDANILSVMPKRGPSTRASSVMNVPSRSVPPSTSPPKAKAKAVRRSPSPSMWNTRRPP